MDCQSARSMLDASRPDRRDWQEPELREAAQHALNCGPCEGVLSERDIFDRRLSATMADVAIPAGLKEWLLQTLAAKPIVPPVAIEVPPRFRLSRRAWLVMAGTLIVALLGGWAYWFLGRGGVTLNEVYADINSRFPLTRERISLEHLRPFNGRFDATITDPRWIDAVTSEPVGLNLFSLWGHDAAIYRFAVGRSRSLSGLLILMDAHAIEDPPTSPVPTRRHSRYDPRPQVTWRHGDQVYVCILERGTLDEVLRAMYGGTK